MAVSSEIACVQGRVPRWIAMAVLPSVWLATTSADVVGQGHEAAGVAPAWQETSQPHRSAPSSWRALPALQANSDTFGPTFLWLTVGSATRTDVLGALGPADSGEQNEPVWLRSSLLSYHGLDRVMARFDGRDILVQLRLDLTEPVQLARVADTLALGARTETRDSGGVPGELHIYHHSAVAILVDGPLVRSIWLLPNHRGAGPPYTFEQAPSPLPQPLPTLDERLVAATRDGDLLRVVHLLMLGAEPFARDAYGRNSAHHAAMRGHTQVLKLLLKTLEPSSDLPLPSLQGQPVFGHGVDGPRLPTFAFDDFIFRLDSVNAADDDGLTPLHLAARAGHVTAATILLDAQADPNKAANDGSTPLHHAARAGQPEMVELLVARGAFVDDRDVLGRTPREVSSDPRLARRLSDLEKGLQQSPSYRDTEQTLAIFFQGLRQGDSAVLSSITEGSPSSWGIGSLGPVAFEYRLDRIQVRYGTAEAQGTIQRPRTRRSHEFWAYLLETPEGWRVAEFEIMPPLE